MHERVRKGLQREEAAHHVWEVMKFSVENAHLLEGFAFPEWEEGGRSEAQEVARSAVDKVARSMWVEEYEERKRQLLMIKTPEYVTKTLLVMLVTMGVFAFVTT